MDTGNARLFTYDITVAFPALKLGSSLAEHAPQLLPQHPRPFINWIPDQLLTIVYPERQIQCQFTPQAAQIMDHRGGQALAEEPFPTVALNAIKAVIETSATQPRAYGLNFAVMLPQADPAAFLKTKFIHNPEALGESFGGSISGIGISATISAPPAVINFSLNPAAFITQVINVSGLPAPPVPPVAPETFVQAAVNYHFEGGKPPETGRELADQIKNHYDTLIKSLEKL